MADLLSSFKDKAEALVTSLNSEGGVRGTIESLRRRMAEADRRRAVRRLQDELQRIERQIGEMLTDVGVQAVALQRASALNSPELAPLCERIIDLETLLQEQKRELQKIEAEAQAQRLTQAGLAVCPHCGHPHTQDVAFCPHCGQAVKPAIPSTFCAHCGAPLRSGARFCPRCGHEAVD
ncbi:MAG: zinc-ribbon domain-containing protein [Chloroflexi bacterium]|nr:zinc-ribbon domain-containing protein [Chloroflexota bacterium]